MSVKHYSLLDYSISVKSPNLSGGNIDIPMGGRGSFLGSVSISRDVPNITKQVDSTGSGVFNYSADNSGSITFELTYISDTAANIINKIASKYRDNGDDQEWKTAMVDIYIRNGQGENVVIAKSVMLQGLEELTIAAEVPMRSFTFLAMDINEVTKAL